MPQPSNSSWHMAPAPLKIDIGCGKKKRPGFLGLDSNPLSGVDIVHDLTRFPWPLEDNCAEELVMDNVIEHLPDTVATFNELHRIARPGSRVEIIYPYWRSFGAYGDPTHVRYFNEYLIDYFLPPGTTPRLENQYAFYTDRYWKLMSRKLITHPGLGWLPNGILSFVSRHFIDIVSSVRIVISPDKK